MNKDELILAAKAAIAKIEQMEREYEGYPDLAETLEVKLALALKKHISKLLASATALPPAAEVTDNIEEYNATLRLLSIKLTSANKDYDGILHRRKKVYGDSRQRELIFMKQRVVTLVDFLKSEFSSYPLYYQKDSTFKAAKDALDESISTSSVLVESSIERVRGTSKQQEEALRDVIPILEEACQQQVNLRKVAQQRLAILDDKRARYEKAVAAKQTFLEDISSLLDISQESLTLIATSNEALVLQIKELQVQVEKLKAIFPDDPGVFLTNGGTFDSMGTAARNCSAEVSVLWQMSEPLKKPVREFIQKIKIDIARTFDDFKLVYETIYRQIEEAHVDKTAINAIKTRFDRVLIDPQVDGVDSIDYLHKKSLELKKIVTEFGRSIPSLQAPVKEAYLKKMGLIKSHIELEIAEVCGKAEGYRITSAEDVARLTLLRSHLDGDRSQIRASRPLEDIMDRHRQLIASQEGIMPLIDEINRHLRIHDDVVSVLKVNVEDTCDFTTLAANINTSFADGSALFVLLNQYLNQGDYVTEAKFLSQLARHLELYNPTGLDAIKLFIAPKMTPEAVVLKEKLAFIDSCTEKGIDYRPYLLMDHVIAATLHLKNWGFGEHISLDTCRNNSFSNAICVLQKKGIKPTPAALETLKSDISTCEMINTELMDKALEVLRTAEITLSWDIVQKLLAEPIKCEVICQQNTYRESQYGSSKIALNTFKGVLNDIVDTEQLPIIKALSAVGKYALSQGNTRWPNCCMHSFVYLLKEGPKIAAILGQGHLKENISFLTPLIKLLPTAPLLSTYWKSKGEPDGRNPGGDFKAHLGLYGDVLDKLFEANQQPKACALPSMAHFMWEFNGFLDGMVTGYRQPDKKDFINIIEQFRRQSMPILLAPKTLEEKKEDLENLARSTFKPKHHLRNIRLDVLQFISLLFIVIMPVRVAFNKSALFQQERSEIHNQISDFKKAYKPSKADDEPSGTTPSPNS